MVKIMFISPSESFFNPIKASSPKSMDKTPELMAFLFINDLQRSPRPLQRNLSRSEDALMGAIFLALFINALEASAKREMRTTRQASPAAGQNQAHPAGRIPRREPASSQQKPKAEPHRHRPQAESPPRLKAFPQTTPPVSFDPIVELEVQEPGPLQDTLKLAQVCEKDNKNYEKFFGLKPDFTLDELNKSYKKFFFNAHPDKNPKHVEQAKQLFQWINEARDVLKKKKEDEAKASMK